MGWWRAQKRGSVMRRVWPVMDCVIIQPWRCRSLERNGLLCLLLLCQCNHSESRCYKSPALHSWCWNRDESVRKHLVLTRCCGLRGASGLLEISDSLILWAGWIINNQQLCVCAGVYTCWGYFMSVLQTERFNPNHQWDEGALVLHSQTFELYNIQSILLLILAMNWQMHTNIHIHCDFYTCVHTACACSRQLSVCALVRRIFLLFSCHWLPFRKHKLMEISLHSNVQVWLTCQFVSHKTWPIENQHGLKAELKESTF